MRRAYAALGELVLDVTDIAAYAAPAHTPPSTTAMPPNASIHRPPDPSPLDTRAPYAATRNAMPHNPDARTAPEQPIKPQLPSPNPPPCR